jgi:hypothetical protein
MANMTQEQKQKVVIDFGIDAKTTNEQYKAIYKKLTGGN